jgi:hypothetical protein
MSPTRSSAASEPRPFSEAAKARELSPIEIATAWAEARSTRVRVAVLMGHSRYPHSACGRCEPNDPYCPADVELIEESREGL